MLKKSVLTLVLICVAIVGTNAQSIKGVESVSYFQAPAQGVKFEQANVFLSYDQDLANVKKEAQQARNSANGAKLGSVGSFAAQTVNSAMDLMGQFNALLSQFQDEEGRFAVWNFVPGYIIAEAQTKERVNVEIFILNEDETPPGYVMPTTADKEGYYYVPYNVNCRYKITLNDGTILHEENLGQLTGAKKTKDYTPPTASTGGGLGSLVSVEEEGEEDIPVQYKIGTNAAYNKVFDAVFSRFGFAQLSAPIKLGVVKEAKASKKMIKPTLAIFENKKGLVLNKDEKIQVAAFAEEMEKAIDIASEKTKWVALHNLSVCYAWLEDSEKASKYYQMYGEEISLTLKKMDCWNKVINRTMTPKEMKEICGFSSLGMKDGKRYTQYNNIKNFVTYYPLGAQRYSTLIAAVNRDLKRFVDFYAVNDLLCQLFEIDLPYQFFPLQEMKGAPKDCKGIITKAGMEPIEYRVKYDMKRRIKKLEADQITKLEDGSKEKLITRDLMPQYNDNNRYTHIETDAGSWAKGNESTYYFRALNDIYDPLLKNTTGKANNITKKAGFLGGKTSRELVQLKVDLDGNIYFTGKSDYFKANAFFKDIMNGNGIVPKRVDTKTTFKTKTQITENGVMNDWMWEGDVTTSFAGGASSRTQKLTAEPMVRGIKYLETDENGNPIKAQYTFKLKGSVDIEAKMSIKEWFEQSYAQGRVPNGHISSESIDIEDTGVWDCTFEYDAEGNWTSMNMGPYSATRELKY